MNEDRQLQTYKEKWQSVKLSDSSRARIEDNLRSYTAFHSVREADNSRSIEQVPRSTFLHRLKLTTMPIAIFLALFVTVGTSFAAQGALPGDFLYPVKTEVNENIRGAFAVTADAEADLQADLLEERLKEAQTLHASGKLRGDTAVAVSKRVNAQVKVATNAAAKSDASVAAKTNTRVKAGLENFLAIVGLDASIASEVNAILNASTLSTGTYAIDAYQEDMNVRVKSLKEVMVKYQAEVEANIYTDLNVKLDTAAALTSDAKVQAEVDARASLDKAATLVGEVEAKLSTLGQAAVNEKGIITDIDFSIDPMKIDIRGDADAPTSQGNDKDKPKQDHPRSGGDIDINLNGGVDTEVIEVDIEGGLEAVSGLAQ